MTKLWFKTKNDQIVDLNTNRLFTMVKVGEKHFIFAGNDEIGNFDTKEEAQAYLDEIFDEIFDLLTFAKEKKRMEDAREDFEKLLVNDDITNSVDSSSNSVDKGLDD